MKTVFHAADSRGHAQHGWLDSYHTFSFGNYYHPERMNFGTLRVLNDDTVQERMGFGTHPHDNMEIISIPLEGDLEHRDSMGNVAIIKEGEIQVMSAGSGVTHSEKNKNNDSVVKFLQIWVLPKVKNATPRYDQIAIKDLARDNEFYQILSPNPDDQGVWIHQDAWFHLGHFNQLTTADYSFHQPGNGVYAFVLEGELEINGQVLKKRDGLGIWDTNSFSVTAQPGAEALLMEVGLSF